MRQRRRRPPSATTLQQQHHSMTQTGSRGVTASDTDEIGNSTQTARDTALDAWTLDAGSCEEGGIDAKMMLRAQSPSSAAPGMDPSRLPQASAGRKRKAEAQKDNERLSKRLSLLNIEHDGTKLYVPVESPSPSKPQTTTDGAAADDTMRLDDSKHKVYIYNIDEELAEDSEPDEAKLVFLPDIEKRLRESRIPPQILANSDGELAGMQLVLYSDPKSLSVPEAKDGVRKAIIDARRRIRARQAGAEDDDVNDISAPSDTTRMETTGLHELDDVEMDLD